MCKSVLWAAPRDVPCHTKLLYLHFQQPGLFLTTALTKASEILSKLHICPLSRFYMEYRLVPCSFHTETTSSVLLTTRTCLQFCCSLLMTSSSLSTVPLWCHTDAHTARPKCAILYVLQ